LARRWIRRDIEERKEGSSDMLPQARVNGNAGDVDGDNCHRPSPSPSFRRFLLRAIASPARSLRSFKEIVGKRSASRTSLEYHEIELQNDDDEEAAGAAGGVRLDGTSSEEDNYASFNNLGGDEDYHKGEAYQLGDDGSPLSVVTSFKSRISTRNFALKALKSPSLTRRSFQVLNDECAHNDDDSGDKVAETMELTALDILLHQQEAETKDEGICDQITKENPNTQGYTSPSTQNVNEEPSNPISLVVDEEKSQPSDVDGIASNDDNKKVLQEFAAPLNDPIEEGADTASSTASSTVKPPSSPEARRARRGSSLRFKGQGRTQKRKSGQSAVDKDDPGDGDEAAVVRKDPGSNAQHLTKHPLLSAETDRSERPSTDEDKTFQVTIKVPKVPFAMEDDLSSSNKADPSNRQGLQGLTGTPPPSDQEVNVKEQVIQKKEKGLAGTGAKKRQHRVHMPKEEPTDTIRKQRDDETDGLQRGLSLTSVTASARSSKSGSSSRRHGPRLHGHARKLKSSSCKTSDPVRRKSCPSVMSTAGERETPPLSLSGETTYFQELIKILSSPSHVLIQLGKEEALQNKKKQKVLLSTINRPPIHMDDDIDDDENADDYNNDDDHSEPSEADTIDSLSMEASTNENDCDVSCIEYA
jgi:hypothetical protein